MKRLVPLLLLCLALLGGPARAQQLRAGSPALIKYGKWLTLAASATMNVLAEKAHNRADDAFDVINRTCFADKTRCTIFHGHYTDPLMEHQYQLSVGYDRTARGWLVGGETLLAATAVAFIWELTRPKSRPGNIPFEPQVTERNGATVVGFQLHF
jgi:hypothetical protein